MAPVTLSRLVDTHKALAHPARLRILAMLRDGEMCVCQIIAALGLAGSTISAHVRELRRAGLIDARKDGRWVYYRLEGGAEVRDLLQGLWDRLGADARVQLDRSLTRKIRKFSPQEVRDAGLDLTRLGITPKRGKRTAR